MSTGVRLSLSVLVADRPGALERLLGLIRRRAMQVYATNIVREGPGGAGGSWRVVVTAADPEAPMERYAHEIRQLVDVESVDPVARESGP